SLNEVADEPLLSRAVILVVVALGITALVYGVVALIVRMDDVGVGLAARPSRLAQRFGTLLVKAMPRVLQTLSVVGIAAMLWVGGHIILVGTDDLGWHTLHDVVHDLEHRIAELVSVGDAALAWGVDTAASALLGLIVGAVAVTLVEGVTRRRGGATAHCRRFDDPRSPDVGAWGRRATGPGPGCRSEIATRRIREGSGAWHDGRDERGSALLFAPDEGLE